MHTRKLLQKRDKSERFITNHIGSEEDVFGVSELHSKAQEPQAMKSLKEKRKQDQREAEEQHRQDENKKEFKTLQYDLEMITDYSNQNRANKP